MFLLDTWFVPINVGKWKYILKSMNKHVHQTMHFLCSLITEIFSLKPECLIEKTKKTQLWALTNCLKELVLWNVVLKRRAKYHLRLLLHLRRLVIAVFTRSQGLAFVRRRIAIEYKVIFSITAANVFAPFERRFTRLRLVFGHYDWSYKYRQCTRKDPR